MKGNASLVSDKQNRIVKLKKQLTVKMNLLNTPKNILIHEPLNRVIASEICYVSTFVYYHLCQKEILICTTNYYRSLQPAHILHAFP